MVKYFATAHLITPCHVWTQNLLTIPTQIYNHSTEACEISPIVEHAGSKTIVMFPREWIDKMYTLKTMQVALDKGIPDWKQKAVSSILLSVSAEVSSVSSTPWSSQL